MSPVYADHFTFDILTRSFGGTPVRRFNSDDPVSGGVPKRGGYFETAPRNGRTKPKPSPTVSSTARSLPAPTQTAPKPASIIQAPPRDPGPSEEEARIEVSHGD
jgi:hypothetical protein